MGNIFSTFKTNVLSALGMDCGSADSRKPEDRVDNLLSLGVLLWEVARSDSQFLPKEEGKIAEILHDYGHISTEDMPIVMRAIEEASIEKIDLYAFTNDVGPNLHFDVRTGIIENLFRVACIDGDLDHEEHEMIRKISGLLHVDHKDFIDIKIRIKKEFGMDTAGL